jgi:hypothetical protein
VRKNSANFATVTGIAQRYSLDAFEARLSHSGGTLLKSNLKSLRQELALAAVLPTQSSRADEQEPEHEVQQESEKSYEEDSEEEFEEEVEQENGLQTRNKRRRCISPSPLRSLSLVRIWICSPVHRLTNFHSRHHVRPKLTGVLNRRTSALTLPCTTTLRLTSNFRHHLHLCLEPSAPLLNTPFCRSLLSRSSPIRFLRP